MQNFQTFPKGFWVKNGKIWTVVSWGSVSIVLPRGENKIGSRANRVGQGGAEQEEENKKAWFNFFR